MGNCKDCKYWRMQELNGICRRIDIYFPRKAYITVSDYADAELVTAQNFGCVLFEQKESKQ